MKYKNYEASVKFDEEIEISYGEVINTRDVITFQGESVSQLTRAFRDSIDDYLAFCTERGEAPDKPFSGQFATRIPPDLHRQISLAASRADVSLNSWVIEQLRAGLAARKPTIAKGRKAGTGKRTRARADY